MRTDSVMPATSSMTIEPGSLVPAAASATCAAHVPRTVTTTKNTSRPAGENGTSQRIATATALPAVPGAIGE